ITTEANAKGKMVQKVYNVADIIIPVENHTDPSDTPLARALQTAAGQTLPASGTGMMPWRQGVQGGTPVSMGTGGLGDMANQQSRTGSTPTTTTRSPTSTLEELLMELIMNTIKPESWSKVGG